MRESYRNMSMDFTHYLCCCQVYEDIHIYPTWPIDLIHSSTTCSSFVSELKPGSLTPNTPLSFFYWWTAKHRAQDLTTARSSWAGPLVYPPIRILAQKKNLGSPNISINMSSTSDHSNSKVLSLFHTGALAYRSKWFKMFEGVPEIKESIKTTKSCLDHHEQNKLALLLLGVFFQVLNPKLFSVHTPRRHADSMTWRQ